jgi:hypothetical protein
MKKGIINLVTILLIINSLFNILDQLSLPPLCPAEGIIKVDKCRYYNLSSNEVDNDGYPKKHKDSNKFYKNIVNMYIIKLIFYFLILCVGISYFIVPAKFKKLSAYLVIGFMSLNCIMHIFSRISTPPMCSLEKKNTHSKCVNYNLYTNYVDYWGYPINHTDSIKFHKDREGLQTPEIIGYIVMLCITIFALIKK